MTDFSIKSLSYNIIAGSSIKARVWYTIIDIVFTLGPIESLLTVAGVIARVAVARPIVQTWRGRAVVNLYLTVSSSVTSVTYTSVIVDFVHANAVSTAECSYALINVNLTVFPSKACYTCTAVISQCIDACGTILTWIGRTLINLFSTINSLIYCIECKSMHAIVTYCVSWLTCTYISNAIRCHPCTCSIVTAWIRVTVVTLTVWTNETSDTGALVVIN